MSSINWFMLVYIISGIGFLWIGLNGCYQEMQSTGSVALTDVIVNVLWAVVPFGNTFWFIVGLCFVIDESQWWNKFLNYRFYRKGYHEQS